MLITIGLPITSEIKYLLPPNQLKRRQDESFLGEELNTLQALSGEKV